MNPRDVWSAKRSRLPSGQPAGDGRVWWWLVLVLLVVGGGGVGLTRRSADSAEGQAVQVAERVSSRQVYAAGRPFDALGDGLPTVDVGEDPSVLMVEMKAAPLTSRSIGPEPLATWPPSVALKGVPEVEAMPEDARGLFLYRTRAYQFECDVPLGADAVRAFARVFEATHELNCLLPLGIRPTPERLRSRFVARIYSDDETYFEEGGMAGSAGTYRRGEARIMVPISSLGVKLVNGRVQTDWAGHEHTLLHEITHQMMNRWLPRLPQWYVEGSAEWVAMADYIHGRFFLGQMEDRLREYLFRRERVKGRFTMIPPAELMAISPQEWAQMLADSKVGAAQNYASAAVLTFYFYHWDGEDGGGQAMEWLRAIEGGEPTEMATERHLMRGRRGEELEREISAALRRLGIEVNFESV